jgi:hypothetical protein
MICLIAIDQCFVESVRLDTTVVLVSLSFVPSRAPKELRLRQQMVMKEDVPPILEQEQEQRQRQLVRLRNAVMRDDSFLAL